MYYNRCLGTSKSQAGWVYGSWLSQLKHNETCGIASRQVWLAHQYKFDGVGLLLVWWFNDAALRARHTLCRRGLIQLSLECYRHWTLKVFPPLRCTMLPMLMISSLFSGVVFLSDVPITLKSQQARLALFMVGTWYFGVLLFESSKCIKRQVDAKVKDGVFLCVFSRETVLFWVYIQGHPVQSWCLVPIWCDERDTASVVTNQRKYRIYTKIRTGKIKCAGSKVYGLNWCYH